MPSRTVPEGTPFYRASESTPVCPACRVPLCRNEIPGELLVVGVSFALMMAWAALAAFERTGLWASAVLAAFVLVHGARAWYVTRYLKEWRVWTLNEHAR